MSWYGDFVAELNRPVEKCTTCDHDVDGHEGVMGVYACMFCGCQASKPTIYRQPITDYPVPGFPILGWW